MPLYLYFCLFYTLIVQLVDKILQMTGIEPQISGVGSDHSTNWATTTAQISLRLSALANASLSL